MRFSPALAAVLSVAALAACPSPASALQMAVQDDPTFVYGAHDQAASYQHARELKARTVRFNLFWDKWVQEGFGPLDAAIARARAEGFRVHLTVTGTPAYNAQNDLRLSAFHPDPKLMAWFAGQAAARWKGQVSSYGVWNEPNIDHYLKGTPAQAARRYAALYQAAWKAIKAADPAAQVWFGELSARKDALQFLARAVKGRRLQADGLAFHPYQPRTSPLRRDPGFVGIGRLADVRRALAAAARAGSLSRRGRPLPMHITEFGYMRGGLYRIPEARRALWSAQAVQVAARAGVRTLVWYQLNEPPQALTDPAIWDGSLLLIGGGPTPAWDAVRGAAGRWAS